MFKWCIQDNPSSICKKRPVFFGSVTKDFVKRRQSRVYKGHFLDSVVKWCSPQLNRVNKESVFSHTFWGVLITRMYCTSFLIGSFFDNCNTLKNPNNLLLPLRKRGIFGSCSHVNFYCLWQPRKDTRNYKKGTRERERETERGGGVVHVVKSKKDNLDFWDIWWALGSRKQKSQ